MDDEDDVPLSKKKSEAKPRRRPKKIVLPRRAPSVVVPGRQVVYVTADKTTCEECPCYPKEDPYRKPKKLSPCQKSPLTLYELAAAVVDSLPFPPALSWSEEEVAYWIEEEVGLPQYKECLLDNHVNGMRLLMLENPSHLPEINIHHLYHIQLIAKRVRQLYTVEFVRFARSIGLPPRKPLTHCTWFKSRTGSSWGIRQNWTRSDILRWMKIVMPAPVYRDHWDLVWYHKPDYPKVKFARIKMPKSEITIPQYKAPDVVCKEYQVPRKFRFQSGIPEEEQLIWMEHRPGSPVRGVTERKKRKKERKERKRVKMLIPPDSRLIPKKISLTGLQGKDLVLARRKMAKPKFLV